MSNCPHNRPNCAECRVEMFAMGDTQRPVGHETLVAVLNDHARAERKLVADLLAAPSTRQGLMLQVAELIGAHEEKPDAWAVCSTCQMRLHEKAR